MASLFRRLTNAPKPKANDKQSKSSGLETLLQSVNEFSDCVERSETTPKQRQILVDRIIIEVVQAVGEVTADSSSKKGSSSRTQQGNAVLLEDVVSRFCWILFEAATDVKLVRKLHKGVITLAEIYPKITNIIDCQFLVLLSENGGCMTNSQTAKVCNLLEGSTMVHTPLAAHFPQFLGAMTRTSTCVVADIMTAAPSTVITPDLSAHSLTLAKLALQMCQLVPHPLGEVLSASQGRQSDLTPQLSEFVGNLFTMMCCKKFSRESGLMSGCAMGMMFNSVPDSWDAVSMTTSLLYTFLQDTSIDFQADLGLFSRLLTPPFQSFSPPEKAFGTLCLAKGLLMCADPRILLEKTTIRNSQDKEEVFLLGPLLNITQELLADPLTPEFHSIQLFTLWLQCVHRQLEALHSQQSTSNGTQPFLSKSSPLVEPVLRCIWRHWHSPIDGVPELIRNMFGALLEAYQAENRLLKSADDELLQMLAHDLLTSPVHLKGRYTLLSTLIPHLGASNALRLHPTLPAELLSCLDTHHLVFAANEAYKTLAAGLKAEHPPLSGQSSGHEKEEKVALLLKTWKMHFQGVVLTGLCSSNSLVRNNMANTWLPATFKSFPETFSSLLDAQEEGTAGTSNEHEAKDLHRKIIVLKQARSYKLLQGHEWMQQHKSVLHSAANHQSDAIRGDTVYLVCHSPKTAEPVVDDEASLVKTMMLNCLNSDDTSLRNQLRISIKALVLRLRDSSLAWLKKLQPALQQLGANVDGGSQDLQPAAKALQSKLHGAMELLDWLLLECYASLFPGACYQRRRASLDLLRLVYENFTVGKEKTGNHGNSNPSLQASLKNLLSWTQQLGKINLFSERNASLLVNCLLDSSNDIRSSAYDLLIGFFPWPLPSSPSHPWSSPSEILCQGMKLICSPKFHECEAGAMLCKLTFHRQMVESSEGLEEMLGNSKKQAAAAASASVNSKKTSGHDNPPVQFLVSLLKSLKYQFKCAKLNILRAAALTPMHGIILAIRKCLTEDSRVFHSVIAKDPEAWQAIVREINSMLRKIIIHVLDLLAGKSNVVNSEVRDSDTPQSSGSSSDSDPSSPATTGDADVTARLKSDNGSKGGADENDVSMESDVSQVDSGDAAAPEKNPQISGLDANHISPSFGKMGEEIEKLVSDFGMGGGEEDGDDDMSALSLEHQLILSCCWLTLKESSLLMGALAEIAPPFGDFRHSLLDKDQFELMSDCLVQILTKCRHKGALEGCKAGFFKVCAAMLSCPSPDIASIPRSLLELVFTVVTSTATSSSYTKKSAGLPPLVEAIVTAEPRGRERHLLRHTVTKLMEIARQPLPEQPDAKLDLPQSHALNILRVLFVNSGLAWDVLPYAEEAVQLAINGFASSNWSIQNSSMQLLGALIARIFGQKKVQDEHSQVNTLSAPEFFQRYPRLQACLLQEVRRAADLHRQGAAGQGGAGRLQLIPTLHPVLLVLTKLGSGMATEEQKRQLSEFIEPIRVLASSSIYSVRDLASRALLPLLSENEAVSNMAARLLDTLPPSSHPVIFSQNRLHGDLLTVQKLLDSNIKKKNLPEDKVEEITEKLSKSLWIGTNTNPCALTRALFMDICRHWWEGAFHVKPDDMSSLMVDAKSVLDEFFTKTPLYQMGLSTLGQKMTSSFLSMSEFIPSHVTDLSTLTCILLSNPIPEVREVTLSYLRKVTDPRTNQTRAIQLDPKDCDDLWKQVTELLLVEKNPSCMLVALDLWVELTQCLKSKPDGDWTALLSRLLGMTNVEASGMNLCAAALPALSLAIKLTIDCSNFAVDLTVQWSDLVLKLSDPAQCETLRLSAAKALQHAGIHAINLCKPEDVTHCDIAFMLMRAGMLLLQDEQPDVRDEAARFASLIPRGEGSSSSARQDGSTLHCSTGLQVLLKYVCDGFCQNTDFLDTIVSLLVGDAFSVRDLIEAELRDNSMNLFEQESVNIYGEGVKEARAVYQALKHVFSLLVETQSDVIREWVEARWPFTQRSTARLIKYLKTHPVTANSFYAGTGHSKPYQALYRLLLYITLLNDVAILVNQTGDRVLTAKRKTADHLKSLDEMFFLFPLLKDAIPTNLLPDDVMEEPVEMD